MLHTTVVKERDSSGRSTEIQVNEGRVSKTPTPPSSTLGMRYEGWLYFTDLLTRVFLPVGYPHSVSPDYLQYQILNALQAFCNSLAGMLSSRAVLQGFGVGDPTATPTRALLLTVLQDVFSRLTTILSAHFLGSSLYPEAKTYRLLADILNDTSVILDTISPLFASFSLPSLRVGSLCLSAVFRSLCGISAGGSKAAITMHFATPVNGKGDVGDLNAKDASKETVLALFGMLLGAIIVPYITTPWTTYGGLFTLVALHLGINYFGVRGLVLRSLNRQRLTIAWMMYRKSKQYLVPTPSEVADRERIFERPGTIRDVHTNELLGHCTIGSSLSGILRDPIPSELLGLFQQEQYLIWFDQQCLLRQSYAAETPNTCERRIHICLKEGHTPKDHFMAWIHAAEVCRIGFQIRGSAKLDNVAALGVVRDAYNAATSHIADFTTKLESVGWSPGDYALMTGSPNAVVTYVASAATDVQEDKKSQ